MVYINNDKINLIGLNDSNFYVIMDFDNTITTNGSTNSWSILENPNFIDPQLSIDSNEFVKKYYPYELDYSLDFATKSALMQEWYYKNINLYYEYGMTYDILLNCVKNANVTFRKGVKDFLKLLYEKHIPVIILSAGIGNVIYELFKFHNCLYDNIHIISNFIKFENGKMLPFTDTIIHSCNKSISKLPIDFSDNIKNREHILLFGDLIEDLNMVSKDELEKSISFGFLENNVEKNFEIYKSAFDVVLTDNSSFIDVQDILKKLNFFA